MSQADRIISKFGGISAAARALGFPKSSVQRWKISGSIPPRHNEQILAAAALYAVPLTSDDFLTVDRDHPAFQAEAH